MVAGSEVFLEEIETLSRSPLVSGRVLLYGSSTIRLWERFREDLPGVECENRGFGGSTLEACAQAWDVLGKPARAKAVVVYAGDNDLDQGAAPEEVAASFRALLRRIRGRSTRRIPVCIVSVKPSPSRWHLIDKIRRTNRILEDVCGEHQDTWFLDLFSCFLDGDLRPRSSLFQQDGLHLAGKGYRILSEGVARWLDLVGCWSGPVPGALAKAPGTDLLPRTLRLHRPSRGLEEGGEIRREYHRWHSPVLGRDMELLVFGHGGERVLVFPSRMERFYEWENRGMVHACRERLEAGHLQLLCLDGLDTETFYAFASPPAERIARHFAYERYVLEEVLPFSERINPGTTIGTAGCSLGAFHAAAIFFRHPARFRHLRAFSGRFDLTRSFGPEYPDLFLGYREPPVYFLNPTHFLPNLRDTSSLSALRESEILLVVGESDPFRASNIDLSDILWSLGVSHQVRTWVGSAHRFRTWRQMARLYF